MLPVPYGRGFRLLFCLCAAAAAGVKFGCASLAIRLFFRGLPLLRDGVACDDGHQILAREIAFDGVLCGSDRIAAGVITALNEAGLSVPADVSVVGFDDHEIATRCVPALTTVRQPLREEGHMAANIALDMIKGAEPTTSVMHMQLIQRDSL